jgi:hypothetical protein
VPWYGRLMGWLPVDISFLQASWKKFLIDLMYLRGHVTLYPNFPNQTSFSTNHMEPGAHIAAADNVIRHDIADFEVPLLQVIPEPRTFNFRCQFQYHLKVKKVV